MRSATTPNRANAATVAPVVVVAKTDDAADDAVNAAAKAVANAQSAVSALSAATNPIPVAAIALKDAALAAVAATDKKDRAKSRVWTRQALQTRRTCQQITLTAIPASVLPVRLVSAVTADAVVVAVVNAHPQVRRTAPCHRKTCRQRRLQRLLSHKPQTLRAQITA